jgi:hypothetical protein
MQVKAFRLSQASILGLMLLTGCGSHQARVESRQAPGDMFRVCPYVFMNVRPGGLVLAVWDDGRILRSVSTGPRADMASKYELGQLTSEQMARVRTLLADMPDSVFQGHIIVDSTYDELIIVGQGGTRTAYSTRHYHEMAPVREFWIELLGWKLQRSRIVPRNWNSLFPLTHCE